MGFVGDTEVRPKKPPAIEAGGKRAVRPAEELVE